MATQSSIRCVTQRLTTARHTTAQASALHVKTISSSKTKHVQPKKLKPALGELLTPQEEQLTQADQLKLVELLRQALPLRQALALILEAQQILQPILILEEEAKKVLSYHLVPD